MDDTINKLSHMAKFGDITIKAIPFCDDNQIDIITYELIVDCGDFIVNSYGFMLVDCINSADDTMERIVNYD